MTVSGRDISDIHSLDASKAAARRHPTYWFEDGSLIVQIQDVAYKLHKTFLARHSSVLKDLTRTEDGYSVSTIRIPDERGVTSDDFDRLLEHLYHDMYDLLYNMEYILYALNVSIPGCVLICDVQIQKGLYYSVATHMHFEDEDAVPTIDEGLTGPVPLTAVIPADVVRQCKELLDQLLGHFTPILFTVATAGHMSCTDVLAETWMPLVIQPALENNGLCRPIETLQSISDVDWSTHGLCEECMVEKRQEWKGEQEVVWKKLDDWLPTQEQ
ncbi:hypothetical protein EUX98_g1043 [Antrodiella citrinella]|uniref:BTB domain-containing protein n=1 Tax=Antrodiella citrinella TaxID=2447956 RepID=A0A4S4NB35_9APHY|nr:hypothetical protein EUX98_g1043 [Antrodiella citrinella]